MAPWYLLPSSILNKKVVSVDVKIVLGYFLNKIASLYHTSTSHLEWFFFMMRLQARCVITRTLYFSKILNHTFDGGIFQPPAVTVMTGE